MHRVGTRYPHGLSVIQRAAFGRDEKARHSPLPPLSSGGVPADKAEPAALFIPRLHGKAAGRQRLQHVLFSRIDDTGDDIGAARLQKRRNILRQGNDGIGHDIRRHDGITAAHLVLAAEDEGLGSCIVGWFDETKVRKLLDIPSGKRVLLDIVIGYSTQPDRPKKRKDLKEVISYNRY